MSALAELHQMLSQRGLRRSSAGVHHTHREEQDDQFTQTTQMRLEPPVPMSPRQLSMAFDTPVLRGIEPSERASAIAQLAILLLQAAGVHQTGADDGEH
ncbi:hypothetical protein J7E62_07760 [Variovorax paradoxus]|nr:hypothetical protein [Variovorax paradoxus]